MKKFGIAGAVAPLILVVGCNNEPEETPETIEDVIPADESTDGIPEGAGVSEDAQATGGGQSQPGRSAATQPSTGSSSSSIESGSNSPGSEIDLKGSKLQRADPN